MKRIVVFTILVSMLSLIGIEITARCAAATAVNMQVVTLDGILNAATDDTPTFTPDGKTVFFDRTVGAGKSVQIARRINGRWSRPQTASFSGRWYDQDPALSPDGSFLIFSSNRPIEANGRPITESYRGNIIRGGNLWRVNRSGDNWGEPVWLGDAVNGRSFAVAPTVASDGSVYFIRRDESETRAFAMHVFRSDYRAGRYLPAVRLSLGDPTVVTHDPAIAPDRSFLVFNYGRSKSGLGRLCIALRDGDRWSSPVDLGNVVNEDNPWGSHVGPDRQLLYVTGSTHIWRFSLGPWFRKIGEH